MKDVQVNELRVTDYGVVDTDYYIALAKQQRSDYIFVAVAAFFKRVLKGMAVSERRAFLPIMIKTV